MAIVIKRVGASVEVYDNLLPRSNFNPRVTSVANLVIGPAGPGFYGQRADLVTSLPGNNVVVASTQAGMHICSIDRTLVDGALCDPVIAPTDLLDIESFLNVLKTVHFAEASSGGGGGAGGATESTLASVLAALNALNNGTAGAMVSNTRQYNSATSITTTSKLWAISISVNPASTAYPTLTLNGNITTITENNPYNFSAAPGHTLDPHRIDIPTGCIVTIQTAEYT